MTEYRKNFNYQLYKLIFIHIFNLNFRHPPTSSPLLQSSERDYDAIESDLNDYEGETILKRGNQYQKNRHECTCASHQSLRFDFGQNGTEYYPNGIKTVECESSDSRRCSYGKTCRPIYYEVRLYFYFNRY